MHLHSLHGHFVHSSVYFSCIFASKPAECLLMRYHLTVAIDLGIQVLRHALPVMVYDSD